MSEIAEQALKDAIKAVGSGAELARKIGIKQPSVAAWKRVPIHRVKKVAEITGISPQHLRPDIFGEPQ